MRFAYYPGPSRFVDGLDVRAANGRLLIREILEKPAAISLCVWWWDTAESRGDGMRHYDCLRREIEILSLDLPAGCTIGQVHCRFNGPPVASLMRTIRQALPLMSEGGHSAHIDLTAATRSGLESLYASGFTQLRLNAASAQGGHDLSTTVSEAGNIGFEPIEIAFGYPYAETIRSIRELLQTTSRSPLRLSYPALADGCLTDPGMLSLANELRDAGYPYFGMGYFVRPDDDLATARGRGMLKYDARGYVASSASDFLGVGPDAISRLGRAYCQNFDDVELYCLALQAGRLPVRGGIVLSNDDLARRSVMHSLICNLEVSFEAIGISYLLDFERYFAPELTRLQNFLRARLIEIDGEWLVITPAGVSHLPAICEVFDIYQEQVERGPP